MIRSATKYMRLKTDLQLACSRLKMLQAKKMELSEKMKKEISGHLAKGKFVMAKIKAQNIIKYEAAVEAMEIVEMFCEQLLAKYGLFEQMKELDSDLEECVSSLIWVSPYLQPEVPELKSIFKQLTAKYGSYYTKTALKNEQETVNPELMERIKVVTPSEKKVQKYLRNIAERYDVPEDRKNKMEEYCSSFNSSNITKTNHKHKATNTINLSSSSNYPVASKEFGNLETFEGYGTVTPNKSITCKKAFSDLKVKKNRRPSARWTHNFFREKDLSEMTEGNKKELSKKAQTISNEEIMEDININDNTQSLNPFISENKNSYHSVWGEDRVFENSKNPFNKKHKNNSEYCGKNAFPVTELSSDDETGSEVSPMKKKKNSSGKKTKKTNETLILNDKVSNSMENDSSNNSDFDEPPPYDAVVPVSTPKSFRNEHLYGIKIDVELECFPQYPILPTCPALDDVIENNNDLE
ncbi:UNVERIFIED_CONTAM: IST1-like protein [Trichonephila clavipes]